MQEAENSDIICCSKLPTRKFTKCVKADNKFNGDDRFEYLYITMGSLD